MNSSGDSAVIRAPRLARQWIHVLHQYVALLDELYVDVDSNPEVFSSFTRRMEKCAQPMPQDPRNREFYARAARGWQGA